MSPLETTGLAQADAGTKQALVGPDPEPTIDLPMTVDLPDGATEDRPAISNDAITTDLVTANDPPLLPRPRQHALGFFAFAACALIAIYSTSHEDAGSAHSKKIDVTPAIPTFEAGPGGARAAIMSASPISNTKAAEPRPVQGVEPKRKGTEASAGVVAFESRSFVTSEKAIAAVFVLERGRAVSGRALVQWAVHSGTADAGIDFSDASGTVRFADGQRQLAIYVPLRNDLLKEADETFKVCLRSPRQARIGGGSCAEATIRDDDTSQIGDVAGNTQPADSMAQVGT